MYLKESYSDKKIAKAYSPVIINGTVVNNGLHRLSTGYIVLRIIDPYEPQKEIFNSDRDLSFDEKRNLVVADIPKNGMRNFAFTWNIPENLEKPSLYIRIDLWSPRKLYRKSSIFYYPFLFDTCGWKGFVEIVNNTAMKPLSVFISYSWINASHRGWVLGLADLLVKYGFEVIVDRDLHAGQEITWFMERKISEADIVLMICSDTYTRRANDRTGGAGYETIISSKKYYAAENKEKFIPVTRDNLLPPDDKIPVYLGKTLFIDMDTPDWQGEPLQRLVKAIGRHR